MDILHSFNLKDSVHMHYLAGVAAILFFLIAWTRSNMRSLAHIPTVGPTGTMTCYLGAFRYVKDAKTMIQEGYSKHKRSTFKVANFNRWLVVVSSPQAIDDLRQATDKLSARKGNEQLFALDYSIGPNFTSDPYHVPLIRNQLSKNIGALFPDIRNEIIQSFSDEIGLTDNWAKVSVVEAARQIVFRTSNRILVGFPLCRDPDWIALNIQFSTDVARTGVVINLFPKFMKSIATLLTNHREKVRRGMMHLAPVIEDRKRLIGKYGKNWDGKPNDMLAWLMDEASPVEMSAQNLTLRLMGVNFAAIHNTSMSFSHAVYHLAAMPHYIQPLREEVEAVVNKEGWTKAAMSNLHKVDSFLKESQRFNGMSCITMNRRAIKDFTFTDGTFIPKGTDVCVATNVHRDEDNYANPDVFDGFRFVSEGDGNQMATTNLKFISFGHGRQACPGRFFAIAELKAMMAHLVLNYDIKLENEGVRPANLWFAAQCLPNPTAEVLFRKRRS